MEGSESNRGLCLLPIDTTMQSVEDHNDWQRAACYKFALRPAVGNIALNGYEIHVGETPTSDRLSPLLSSYAQPRESQESVDGRLYQRRHTNLWHLPSWPVRWGCFSPCLYRSRAASIISLRLRVEQLGSKREDSLDRLARRCQRITRYAEVFEWVGLRYRHSPVRLARPSGAALLNRFLLASRGLSRRPDRGRSRVVSASRPPHGRGHREGRGTLEPDPTRATRTNWSREGRSPPHGDRELLFNALTSPKPIVGRSRWAGSPKSFLAGPASQPAIFKRRHRLSCSTRLGRSILGSPASCAHRWTRYRAPRCPRDQPRRHRDSWPRAPPTALSRRSSIWRRRRSARHGLQGRQYARLHDRPCR